MHMEINEFLDEIADALEMPPEEGLSAETDFKGLSNWDSLAVLKVTSGIEIEYGILLKKADYQDCRTLQELYELALLRKQGRDA